MKRISRWSTSSVRRAPSSRTGARAAGDLSTPVRVAEIVAILLAGLLAGCNEEQEGRALLERIRQAEAGYAYQGMKRVMFRSGERVRTFHYFVTHFTGRGGEAGPTIMERGRQTQKHPRRWLEWRSRHDYWLKNLDLLFENYHLESIGKGAVAGRAVNEYRILTNHGDLKRPSLRLFVDEATGLLLRFESFDWTDGGAAVVAEFTTIDLSPEGLPPRPVRKADDERESHHGRRDRTNEEPLPFTPLSPRWLPEGFRVSGQPRRSGRSGKGLKTVYSDGLAWFVIQQWKAKEGTPELVVKRCRRGSGVWMRMACAGIAVHVYGHLDPNELEEVLRSLGPVP